MAVKIIVDSTSDILPDEAERLGIIHMPITVLFGDKEYSDGIDISHSEFYEKLIESDELPGTSQITPIAFADTFEQIVAVGDTAVVITISSKLSGTYQSAVLASKDYEDKIYVVDSENATLGERILVFRALELLKEGLSAAEIAAQLDEEKKKIRLIALLDTLEYLKKGGRISSTAAFVGGILSIKPVVAVENGEVVLLGKARGSKQGNNLLRELVQKCGGINFDKPYTLAYSGLTDDLLKKYLEDNAELWEGQTAEIPVCTVGAAIGTHVGPGAIAVSFFEK